MLSASRPFYMRRFAASQQQQQQEAAAAAANCFSSSKCAMLFTQRKMLSSFSASPFCSASASAAALLRTSQFGAATASAFPTALASSSSVSTSSLLFMPPSMPLLAASVRMHGKSAWDKGEADAGEEAEAAPAKRELIVDTTPVTVMDGKGQKIEVPVLHKFSEASDKLPPWLKQGIEAMGFEKPTLIQSYTVPILENGNDAIGLAPTGSGKTVAFGIPSLSTITRSSRNPQILVLCPVRELCQQTTKVMKNLARFNRNIRICEAYGGAPRDQQMYDMQRGCDVLVATPGRLVDFLESGTIDFSELKFFIFDEADRLLDMGFTQAIEKIFSYVDPRAPRQTMMWSATWPREVQRLASEYLNQNRLMIRVGNQGDGQSVNKNIVQNCFYINSNQERVKKVIEIFRSMGDQPAKTIVFVKKKDTCEEVADGIGRALRAALGTDTRLITSLHGGMPQRYRDKVVESFKTNVVRVLVATDVAARGLDFPDVEHVINFDAPFDIDSYCHRIGRTGRAGRSGIAHTFIMDDTRKLIRDLVPYMQKCGQPVPEEITKNMGYGGGGGGGRGYGGGGGGGYRGRGGGGGGYGGGRGGGGGYGGGRGGGGGYGGGRGRSDDDAY